MEVNPTPTPRSSAAGQSSIDPARSSAATSAPDHGPALRVDPSQPVALMASGNRVGESVVKGADTEDLEKAEALKAMIGDKNMQLRTYRDEASGRSVLEVSDQATGKVVSQYPSDELLRLYAALREPFVDQSA